MEITGALFRPGDDVRPTPKSSDNRRIRLDHHHDCIAEAETCCVVFDSCLDQINEKKWDTKLTLHSKTLSKT